VEVDTGFNNVSALARLMLENHPRPRFSGREFARLQDIAAECRELREDFLASRAPSAESTLRIPDEDSPNILPDTPVTHFLHRLDDVILGARKTLAGLYGLESRPGLPAAEPEPKFVQPEWPDYLRKDYWIDNVDALHYGMKFALGVIICLFVIQALQWPDIGTAMLTCVIVAQTSLGASYRMSVLRIVGAILGGLLAYVFIIVLQPALETIAGFLLAVAPVCWLAAWVGSGSPRIAYIGTQIGFSFANAVLPGYGPVTELNTAWDRVLGILLGIIVVGVIDYLLWPQHSERLVIDRLGLTLRTLGKFLMLEATAASQTPSPAVLMRAIDSDLQKAASLLENAELEPGTNQLETSARILTLDLIIDTMHGIARVVQARHRYYLDEAFRAKAGSLLEHQDAFNRSLSEVLNFLADTVENKPITTPPSARPVLKKLHDSARQLTMNPALDWETRKSILACADLDKILLNYLEELDSLITGLARSHPAEFRRLLEE
jgi:multidrug resistance protein MdtO